MIPPLLGFYAKLFIINSIGYTNIYIAILAIITSVISSVRYLNMIQISNYKFNNIVPMAKNRLLIEKNAIPSYIISILTLF
jgi:NADH:ubiquinone oxidoreductase subunit 2 (subunit N)